MPRSGLYRGFSSFEYQRSKSFSMKDLELVKMDLLNHIFTLKGERVMMPTFGTLIPELVFEPLDEDIVDQVYDELEIVFSYDPRVKIIRLEVFPNFEAGAVMVAAELFYVELNMSNKMDLNIKFEGDK